MEIQFLDGIDIQLLDGAGGVGDPRVNFALGVIGKQMKKDAERGAYLTRLSGGFTNEVGDETESVSRGYDFAGFAGDGGVADDEMIRSYLVRTKQVVDASPATVSAYQNPAELSGMIGYVLDKWDTPDREDAISEMAEREERLMGAGLINADIAGDFDEPTAEDYSLVDNYDLNTLSGLEDEAEDEEGDYYEYVSGLDGKLRNMLSKASIKSKLSKVSKNISTAAKAKTKKAKGGFFKALKATTGNSKLTSAAKDLVAANPATTKVKSKLRSLVAKSRRKTKKTASAANGEAKSIVASATSVSGLGDVGEGDADIAALMTGTDLEYMVSGIDPKEACRTYIARTRQVSAARADLFESEAEQKAVVKACDVILSAWNNDALLSAVLDNMEQNGVAGLGSTEEAGPLDGRLRKKLKKLAKKVGSAVKKAVKATGKAVKKAVKAVGKGLKKLGKTIAKVAKKVWKFLVRFNPLTLLIRAGILAVCRLNMFKISNKCYPGSLEKAEALKMGVSEDEWEKSNKSYGHLKKAYVAIGGKESKLKNCLKKGNKKKWQGVEYPESQADITAAKTIATNTNDPETQTDWDEAKAEMKKQGATEDKSVSTEVATETKKVQVEVIENEKTTKAATPIRETGDTSGKTLATVPKGAKVYVDEKQSDATWMAATWGTYTGYILKSQLAGIGDDDTEAMLVYGLGAIYDQYGEAVGLGDPATGTAVTSAMTTITGIMTKIKKIFGVAQKVVDKVKAVKDKAKAAIDSVKAVKDVKNAVQTVKEGVNTAKNVISSVKDTVNTGKNVVQAVTSTVKNAVDTGKGVVQTVTQTAKAKTSQEAVPSTSATTVTTTAAQSSQPTATSTTQAASGQTTQAANTTTATQAATTAQTSKGSSKLPWILGGIGLLGLVGGLIYFNSKKK